MVGERYADVFDRALVQISESLPKQYSRAGLAKRQPDVCHVLVGERESIGTH